MILFLRLTALLLIARIGARFVAGLVQGLQPEPTTTSGVAMVRDRVCNTFLPRDRALRVTVGGREDYFCSAACRDRALALLPSP